MRNLLQEYNHIEIRVQEVLMSSKNKNQKIRLLLSRTALKFFAQQHNHDPPIYISLNSTLRCHTVCYKFLCPSICNNLLTELLLTLMS